MWILIDDDYLAETTVGATLIFQLRGHLAAGEVILSGMYDTRPKHFSASRRLKRVLMAKVNGHALLLRSYRRVDVRNARRCTMQSPRCTSGWNASASMPRYVGDSWWGIGWFTALPTTGERCKRVGQPRFVTSPMCRLPSVSSKTITRIGVGKNPLHGLCICGQFEMRHKTSISASIST